MTSFLHHLHAQYTTHPDEIAAVVACVTPAAIVRQDKIVRGYDNEVYRVSTEDGIGLIVRIRRRSEVSMADEAWAIAQVRAAGAPVPDVLLCDRRWLDGAERDVMVQRAMAGRPLADLAATLTPEQVRACLVQAGAALVPIHSVAVAGFYQRHHGVWDFASWAEVAASNLRDRTAERAAVLSVGVTAAEFATLITKLDELQRRLPWTQPVLLHGDFTPEHLLFDDALTLTGIIDFGDFQGGSPMIDLHELLSHTVGWGLDEQERVEWVRAGYGPAPIWEHLVERQLMHAIGQTIGSLTYHVAIKDTVSAAQGAARLRQLLAQIQATPIAC